MQAPSLCRRGEPAYVDMLGPFLHFLFCEPQRRSQHALLRRALLDALLPSPSGATALLKDEDGERRCLVSDAVLIRLCSVLPYMQVVK